MESVERALAKACEFPSGQGSILLQEMQYQI